MTAKTASITLAVLLALTSVAACSSPAEEASTDQDASTGQDAGPALTCENVESAWRDFVETHNTCTVDSDCVRVGGTGSCDCVPVLGAPSGEAIHRDARDASRRYFAAWNDCDHHGGTCDAAPADRIWCDNGTCEANAPSCLDDLNPNDAGDAGDVGDTDDGPPNTSDARFEGTACYDAHVPSYASYNHHCTGNVGCTSMPVECGECVCTLCADEYCLESLCDDGGSEQCPGGPFVDAGRDAGETDTADGGM